MPDTVSAKSVKVDFPAEIFDVEVNIALIHQVVVAQQAAARQGSHNTKGRGEVRGGGRKPHRQKGTGRARQGSIRAPQFVGGGVVHGPTPRSYDQRTPKKMKVAALRCALSDRARAGRIHVVEDFASGDRPSTKDALGALAGLTSRPRVLVVLERGDNMTWLSLRNVDSVHLLAVDQLNTYDVLVCDDVVFTKGAFDTFVGAGTRGDSTGAGTRGDSTGAGTRGDSTGAGTRGDSTGTRGHDTGTGTRGDDTTAATTGKHVRVEEPSTEADAAASTESDEEATE